MNTLGAGLSFVLATSFISESEVIEAEAVNQIRTDISYYLISLAAPSLVLFILTLVYFPSQPPSPPSKTSSISRVHFFSSCKQVKSDWPRSFPNQSYQLILISPCPDLDEACGLAARSSMVHTAGCDADMDGCSCHKSHQG